MTQSNRFVVTLVALLGGFLMLAIQAAHAGEREKLIKSFADIRPSVGALYAQESGGDMRFLCSATAVDHYGDETVILTANHCLRKGVSYLINFGDNVLRPLKVWKIPHYEADEKRWPRKFNEPETDAALFLMPGQDVPIVELSKSSRVDDGTKLAMVGYPLGVSKIAYEGIVAGRFDRLGSDMYDYLLLQIFGAPGSSGSSVISVETGEVIAILVAAKEDRGLPVIFATPVEYLRHLRPVRPENGEDEEADAGAVPKEADIP